MAWRGRAGRGEAGTEMRKPRIHGACTGARGLNQHRHSSGVQMRIVVDFSEIPEKQAVIHGRLLNWGRWCYGSGHAQMSPMFRLYRSKPDPDAPVYSIAIPVDTADAAKIARAVIALPEEHRHAQSWYYVTQGSPARACRLIGCGMEHLARLVIDGRTMMINRGA